MVRLPVQAGGESVEVFVAGFGDGDHVFYAQAADGFGVEPGFDGDDIADDEFGCVVVEQRGFVDIEPDAVPCAVGHGGVGVWVSVFGDAEGIAVGGDDFDGGFVDIFAGSTGFGCVLCSGFGFKDGSVHLGELVWDVAVADCAGAVAVISSGANVWEDIDDDGLGGVEDACTSVVAVSADWAAGDDRAVGGGCAALEEGDVDQGDHVLGGERCAIVDELAICIGGRTEDEFAGVSHDFFGDGLCIAEVGEFGFVFGSSFHDTEIEIAGEGDAGLFDHVGVHQRQGAV